MGKFATPNLFQATCNMHGVFRSHTIHTHDLVEL